MNQNPIEAFKKIQQEFKQLKDLTMQMRQKPLFQHKGFQEQNHRCKGQRSELEIA